MLCDAVQNYISSVKGLPFFYVIGDETYHQVLDELCQKGFSVVRISDYCPKPDKYPNIDDLIDYFRTSDIDYRENKSVVVGLGEYLALRGEEESVRELKRLKSTTLGNARVVLLLRGVSKQAQMVIEDDNKMQDQQRAYISSDHTCNLSVVNIATQAKLDLSKGIKGLLHELEEGGTGVYKCTSQLDFNKSLIPVTPLPTSYSILRYECKEIAHENGSVFHTDAVQAVGHIPIDVKGLGIDMLSASAHKFNGPKGIGFFYDSGKHVYPHNDGGAQEFGMRAGTENVAGIVGMAVALKNNCANLESNIKYIMSLEDYFMDLMEHSGVDFIRNGGRNHIPGNINLSFRNADGEAILHRLDLKGICISTGSACDSVNTQISHVIRAIGVPQEYANGTIRISLGKYNTLDDCDSIVEALVKILSLSKK